MPPSVSDPTLPLKTGFPWESPTCSYKLSFPGEQSLEYISPVLSSKVPQFQPLPPKPPHPLPSKAGCPMGNGGYEGTR